MGSRRAPDFRYEVGEHLLRRRGGRIEPVEVIGSTGRPPHPGMLLLRYIDGSTAETEAWAIFRPGEAFDAYLAAAERFAAVIAQSGWDSSDGRRALLERNAAEREAFRAHPAGAAILRKRHLL